MEAQEAEPSESGAATTSSGILGCAIAPTLLKSLDWQDVLGGADLQLHRWSTVTQLRARAEAYEAEGAVELSRICKLLSASISMQLVVNGTSPFIAALQMSNGRSPAPEDLDRDDVLALQILAENAPSPWLQARLADLACVAGPPNGVASWKQGALAARAYLECARGEGEAHDVERRECLQRAMELGWRYLKNDGDFHNQIWECAMVMMTRGLEQKAPGVAFPLAEEVVNRNRRLAIDAATLFERHADQLTAEAPNPLASDMYRKAARLWHAAKDAESARRNHHKSAEVLIALARGPGQAMLQADWMLEGIAELRRHQGDRTHIRELQAELADIRRRITGEMQTISHPIDATEIIAHVRNRVSSDDLYDALLQVAFAFSQWTDFESARNEVLEHSKEFVFQHLFRQVTYNSDGVPVAVAEPFDASNEDDLEKRMVQNISQFDHPLLAQVAIREAVDVLQTKFEPTMADVVNLVSQSPSTPRGHEWSVARGLFAGLNHDWHEAAVFLIPQAEPFVRAAFKRKGIHTLSTNDEGAEEEKSLSELLSHPEVGAVLHPNIVLELKTLLTHKSGHNLRNRYGHGLILDDDLASVGVIVLWWTMLRLVLWPFRERVVELTRPQDDRTLIPSGPEAGHDSTEQGH